MNADFFILLVGAILILVVSLAGIWNYLANQIHQLKAIQVEFLRIARYRRDTIPYLLENYWNLLPPSSSPINTASLLEYRHKAYLDGQGELAEEQQLETLLMNFLCEAAKNTLLKKDIGWLEAQTEIENYHQELQNLETHYHKLRNHLSAKTAKLPFSIFKKFVASQLL